MAYMQGCPDPVPCSRQTADPEGAEATHQYVGFDQQRPEQHQAPELHCATAVAAAVGLAATWRQRGCVMAAAPARCPPAACAKPQRRACRPAGAQRQQAVGNTQLQQQRVQLTARILVKGCQVAAAAQQGHRRQFRQQAGRQQQRASGGNRADRPQRRRRWRRQPAPAWRKQQQVAFLQGAHVRAGTPTPRRTSLRRACAACAVKHQAQLPCWRAGQRQQKRGAIPGRTCSSVSTCVQRLANRAWHATAKRMRQAASTPPAGTNASPAALADSTA